MQTIRQNWPGPYVPYVLPYQGTHLSVGSLSGGQRAWGEKKNSTRISSKCCLLKPVETWSGGVGGGRSSDMIPTGAFTGVSRDVLEFVRKTVVKMFHFPTPATPMHAPWRHRSSEEKQGYVGCRKRKLSSISPGRIQTDPDGTAAL